MPLQSSHFALENSGKGQSCVPKRAKARLKGRYGLVVGYRRLRAELLSPSAQVQFLVNRNHAIVLPTRTPARSKVPERATLSAPCGALSPWTSAIGLHGDTTTLVTEWGWRSNLGNFSSNLSEAFKKKKKSKCKLFPKGEGGGQPQSLHFLN